MDVTSHMFSLDERFPGIGPVGHPQLVLSYDQGMQQEEEKVQLPHIYHPQSHIISSSTPIGAVRSCFYFHLLQV
jgi:hypothetical protein